MFIYLKKCSTGFFIVLQFRLILTKRFWFLIGPRFCLCYKMFWSVFFVCHRIHPKKTISHFYGKKWAMVFKHVFSKNILIIWLNYISSIIHFLCVITCDTHKSEKSPQIFLVKKTNFVRPAPPLNQDIQSCDLFKLASCCTLSISIFHICVHVSCTNSNWNRTSRSHLNCSESKKSQTFFFKS